MVILVAISGSRIASSSTYAIFASSQAQIMAFGLPLTALDSENIYFNVFPETKCRFIYLWPKVQ